MSISNNCLSLMCWVIWKIKITFWPSEWVMDFWICMWKQPSPSVNPANHCGSIVWGSSTKGLSTGTTSGKAFFKTLDKLKFIEALIATIESKPERVRCSRRSIFSYTCIHSSQSARFFVMREYLAKCSIITLISFNDWTLNLRDWVHLYKFDQHPDNF